MRRLLSRVVTLMALIGAGLPSPAEAEELSNALELESQGQLQAALEAFEDVLETPGNSRRELATIYQHLGLLRFAAGDQGGARDALMRLLAIEPSATLPDAAPPELQEILTSCRRRWGDRRLRAEAGESPGVLDGENAILQIRAVDDVAAMVGAVQVLDGRELLADQPGSGPWQVVVPASIFVDGAAEISVYLLDEAGSELWRGRVAVTVAEGRSSGSSGGLAIDAQTQRTLAWTLIGVGGALVLGGGIAVGVDGRPTGQVRVVDGVLEQEVRATATGGWILLSTGLASAVAGLVLLLLMPRESGEDARARLSAPGFMSLEF